MASSIETTSTTTTLKNNGNAYMTVDASDVVSLTNPLPVASGGTGVTASTGSGNVVLSASPTFTGTVSAAAISTTGFTSSGIDDNATSTAITIDSSERLLIGGTQASTTATLQIAALSDNINDGRVEISCFTGSPTVPTESKDWPSPSLCIRDYDSYTKTSVMSFGYSNDAIYQTGNNVWNIRLDGVGAATASSSSTHLELFGPGDLRLGAGGAERMRIAANGNIVAPQIAKGWCSFNGTGTPALNAGSYNVASLTDNGTGDYDVVWATDFADALYAVAVSTNEEGGVPAFAMYTQNATTDVRVRVATHAGAFVDQTYNSCIAWGTQ